MKKTLVSLYGTIHNLVGLYRGLVDIVRAEKNALLDMDLKLIQKITYSKEAMIHEISDLEKERKKILVELAVLLNKPVDSLTISKVVAEIQAEHSPIANKLQNISTALSILIKRIGEQNNENQKLIENSIGHIVQMKENVIQHTSPNSDIYGRNAKKLNQSAQTTLLQKEV